MKTQNTKTTYIESLSKTPLSDLTNYPGAIASRNRLTCTEYRSFGGLAQVVTFRKRLTSTLFHVRLRPVKVRIFLEKFGQIVQLSLAENRLRMILP